MILFQLILRIWRLEWFSYCWDMVSAWIFIVSSQDVILVAGVTAGVDICCINVNDHLIGSNLWYKHPLKNWCWLMLTLRAIWNTTYWTWSFKKMLFWLHMWAITVKALDVSSIKKRLHLLLWKLTMIWVVQRFTRISIGILIFVFNSLFKEFTLYFYPLIWLFIISF